MYIRTYQINKITDELYDNAYRIGHSYILNTRNVVVSKSLYVTTMVTCDLVVMVDNDKNKNKNH